MIFADFTFMTIDVWVLIVSGQTFEVTEYEDPQLTVSLEIKIQTFIKYERFNSFIHSLVVSLRGRVGRNQSPVM